MAYNNPYFYNRSDSVKGDYSYVDATLFSPIYGSSVEFSSRINIIPTQDNTLKILPASENNLTVKFKLRFALNDVDTGNLLKTIELAAGTKFLKFKDPSGIYKAVIGYVEDYSVIKNSNSNINEINIILSSYIFCPLFNWSTSSIINYELKTWPSIQSVSNVPFNKYDIFYINNNIINTPGIFYNKIYNFQSSVDKIIHSVKNNFFVKESEVYFLSNRIATLTSSELIISKTVNLSDHSEIYYIDDADNLITSNTGTVNGVKTLFLNYYDRKGGVSTPVATIQTPSNYVSFKNANDLYLTKKDETISYLNDGPISSSAKASSINIYKYNFSTKTIDLSFSIQPILRPENNQANFFRITKNFVTRPMTSLEHSSIAYYTMRLVNPSCFCFYNNKLYVIAEISFRFREQTISGSLSIALSFFFSNHILEIDLNTKTQKIIYSTSNIFGTLNVDELGRISSINIDQHTGEVYFTKKTIANNSTNRFRIYTCTKSDVTTYSQFDYAVNGKYYEIVDFYVSFGNVYAIHKMDISGAVTHSVLFPPSQGSLLGKTSKNLIDNFFFARDSGNNFDLLTRDFFFEPKLNFEFKNKFDYKQLDYRNSFIENIKYKENENTLKQFNLKFENVSTAQCVAMLLFLEKKCGYRRFLYDFPIFLKPKKSFICTEWTHVFKYDDCHDLDLLLIEDPNPNVYIPEQNERGGYSLI